MSEKTRCVRCGAKDPERIWCKDIGGCSECRLPGVGGHSPRHRYDCSRCKFSWNCGLACGCVLKKDDYPPTPEIVKLARLKAFLDDGDRFIKDRKELADYIEMIWEEGGLMTEGMRDEAEKVYETKRHYSPSNKIWERWESFTACRNKPNGITHREYTINRIQELLESGHKVKYGWCAATMIRTVREYYIFYKKKA